MDGWDRSTWSCDESSHEKKTSKLFTSWDHLQQRFRNHRIPSEQENRRQQSRPPTERPTTHSPTLKARAEGQAEEKPSASDDLHEAWLQRSTTCAMSSKKELCDMEKIGQEKEKRGDLY